MYSWACTPAAAEKVVQKEKTQVKNWLASSMAVAIEKYIKRKREFGNKSNVGLRKTARQFGVPSSTFERRVNGKVAGSEHACSLDFS